VAEAPLWETARWRGWRTRQTVAAALTAGLLLSSAELARCNSGECVSNAEDRATTSLLRPADDRVTVWAPTASVAASGTASSDLTGPITIDAPTLTLGGSASWS
jgi:hypothetical protein